MAYTTTVSRPMGQVIQMIISGFQGGSLSAELTARHDSSGPNGVGCTVLVFDKYMMRTSSRASLTVSVDNLRGVTQVFAAGSGTAEGLFSWWDWGAASSLEGEIERILNRA